ncbi:MAG: DNA-processing protein DprA [Alkalilacustris sp.]
MLSWLRLIRSHRVGPSTFARLLAEHGTAEAALDALPALARASGVKDYAACPRADAEAEIAAAEACGAFALCLTDPLYPAELASIPDAPPLLWVRGNPDALTRPAVAIVGARNASSLGLRMARALAEGLGREGFCIASGLARGIDTAAHGAAQPTGTVAVLAGGVDCIYPAENTPLAARILETGLLISEQPMGLQPQARHFPRRNRLISGVSLGVVVVEAAPRSGSLITVGNALEQGREVMAVPGHPFDGRAGGCNILIRDGATLVRDAADVVAALGAREATPAARLSGATRQTHPDGPPPPRATASDTATATARVAPSSPQTDNLAPRTTVHAAPEAPAIATTRITDTATTMAGTETRTLAEQIIDRLGPSPLAEDQLIRDLAAPAAMVAQNLLLLELDGQIRRQPGGLLARTA